MSWKNASGNYGANLLRPHSWFGLKSPLSPTDNAFRMLEKSNNKDDSSTLPKNTPLPDMTDASVRKRQALELSKLLKNRGRSKTLLSGRAGDQSPTPTRSTTMSRG